MDILNNQTVFLNVEGSTKEAILQAVTQQLETSGYVKNAKHAYNDIMKREAEISTGFVSGIAIPHTQSETVEKTSISIIKPVNSLSWETMDDSDVDLIFLICVPLNGSDEHLKILASLAEMLMDEDVIDALHQIENEDEIVDYIRRKLK